MSEIQPNRNIDEILDVIDMSVGKQIGKDAHTLEAEENLFDLGLTSIGFISMIVEFEQRFGIVFEEDDLDLANFNTLAAINAALTRKLSEHSLAEQA